MQDDRLRSPPPARERAKEWANLTGITFRLRRKREAKRTCHGQVTAKAHARVRAGRRISAEPEKPRILILTSSLGSGHARAAQAIERALRRECVNAEVQVLDWWSLINERVARDARAMYLELVQRHPDLYERLYRLADGTWREMLDGPKEVPRDVRELFSIVHALPIVPAAGRSGLHPSD